MNQLIELQDENALINDKILKFTKALEKAKQERDNYKEAWDNYEVKFNKTKK